MSNFRWFDYIILCVFLHNVLMYVSWPKARALRNSEEVLAILATFLLWRLS